MSAANVALLERLARKLTGETQPALASATLSDIGLTTEADANALVAAVQASIGKTACAALTVEACLENPTIEELAALLSRAAQKSRAAKLMPLATKLMPLAAMTLLVAPAAAFDAGLGFQLDANGCVVDYDPSVDYYPAQRRAMFVKDDVGFVGSVTGYAKHFSIDYHPTFKIVRNLGAIEGGANGTYVLHHCGTPISSITGLPADAVHAPIFEVPVPTVSTDTTIGLAFMEALGQFAKLDVADMTYVSSPCLQELHKCNDTEHDAPDGGWGQPPSQRYIDNIKVSSKLHIVSSDKAHFDHDVTFTATADPTLLGRPEWLKFLAAWFNEEPFANRLFRKIERDLYATQNAAATALKAGAKVPIVAFVSHSAASQWGAASWTFLRPDYKLEAVLKSGGRPVSLSLMPDSDFAPVSYNTYDRKTESLAAVKKVLATVDVLVDETYVPDNLAYDMAEFYDRFGLTSADAADYPFLANNLVLRLDATLGQVDGANQGLDWYEQGVLRPDFFVEELASYSFPAAVPPPVHTTKFMRNLAAGETPRLIDDTDSIDPHCVCDGQTAPASPGPVINDCVDDVCVIQDLTSLPNPPPPPPAPPMPPMPPPLGGDDDSLAGWAIGVIVAVGVLAALLSAGICVLVMREKSGTPIFTSMDGAKNGASA